MAKWGCGPTVVCSNQGLFNRLVVLIQFLTTVWNRIIRLETGYVLFRFQLGF